MPKTHSSPDGQEQVLEKLDNAHLSWFHLKAILISGVGFFTDAYDLFMVSIVGSMIAFVHFSNSQGKLRHGDNLWLKGTALIGTLIGQVVFGVLGDYVGRKKVYGITLLLMIVATVGSALSCQIGGVGLISVFCFWRFILGVGIGGDYPLSAVITSEYGSTKHRGTMVAAVFACQGLGMLAAAGVSVLLLLAYKDAILKDRRYLDQVWRWSVGLGAVPAALTWYLRTRLPETPRFTLQVKNAAALAAHHVDGVLANDAVDDSRDQLSSKASNRICWKDFHAYFTRWRNLKVLIGTTTSWFLLDIAFYSNGLFMPEVLDNMGLVHTPADPPSNHDVWQVVYDQARGPALVNLLGSVPGYWFTVALVEVLGRRNIQAVGFAMMTMLLFLLSLLKNELLDSGQAGAFIALYSLMFFFANFGPNSTTFIIPGEVFPTKYRATAHGISAACGKLGAIIGAFGFGSLNQQGSNHLSFTMGLLALCTLLGLFCTLLLPETKGRTLEELADDMSVGRKLDLELQRLMAAETDDQEPCCEKDDKREGIYWPMSGGCAGCH